MKTFRRAEKTAVLMPGAKVSVLVNVRGDYLFTQIANPTTKDKSFLENRRTTKADSRLHGLGTSIARSIVKRYNGRYAVRIEGGVYYAEFMLDLTYQQEEKHE